MQCQFSHLALALERDGRCELLTGRAFWPTHVELGDVVAAGDVLADLIILDGPTAFVDRHPVRAGTDGFILSLRCLKYVWPGDTVAKVVGNTPLAHRTGYLLEL